jgi:hypothetical protein
MADASGGEADAAPKGLAVLGDRFHIHPSSPLPELDSPTAKAFLAEDAREPSRKLFALICRPTVPPRIEDMGLFKDGKFANMLPLVDWGTVGWPPMGRNVVAVVYEQPLGGRVSDVLAKAGTRMTEHNITHEVIEPLVVMLRDLTDRGVPHRGIRPDNLFYMSEGRQRLVIGDCVTVPPGYDQPLACETIERGMAHQAGRGIGDFKDDFYALGVTLVFLLKGSGRVDELNSTEILRSKIAEGSYSTLAGRERIPLNLLEPLRGLLSDDASQRWGIDELNLWLDGRRLTPLQKKAAPKADRAFELAGVGHNNARSLAITLAGHPEAGARVIKDGSVETWVRRGLGDEELASAIGLAAQGVGASDNDTLLARVCILLDPSAPIRYKGFSFMPDGFGPALAVEYLAKGGAQVPAEVVVRDVPQVWFEAQAGFPTRFANQQRQFGQLRSFLQITDAGYGLERCLYEANPGLHCLSPLIESEHVTTAHEVLPALENAANRVDAKSRPVDRHIAAFIACRFGHDVETHLNAVASPDPATSALGMLSLLAVVQWRLDGSHPYLALASWVGGHMAPALTLYHSRSTRRDIEKTLPKLVRKGRLPEIFNLLDNAQERENDVRGFHQAQSEYAQVEQEIARIEDQDPESEESLRVGGQVAAVTAIVLSLIMIAMIYLMEIW